MKLVDILARELEIWPESAMKLSQSFAGMIFYLDSAGQIVRLVRTGVAEDWRKVDVTRAQWQAAVDALKAEECAHSYANKLGCPECGEAFKPAWTGEGLPPVGTVCEWRDDDSGVWQKVEIRYFSEHTALLRFEVDEGDTEGAFSPSDCQFRPIRTPEQIASEERHAAIKAMAEIAYDATGFATNLTEMGALYDAGYRKFEIVDKDDGEEI